MSFYVSACITPPPVVMRKISIRFHIYKLPFAKFECSARTTSLETLQELFVYYQNILHWVLTIKL